MVFKSSQWQRWWFSFGVICFPENLLLTADHRTVKLADFGLAREESLTEMMTAETGTYRWMAPEVKYWLDLLFCFLVGMSSMKGDVWHLNNWLQGYWPILLQLYSTVTLRQGEKKHYNHKVDAYSFAIVLWELIHNKLPFEGMSNLQAAYAAAFKVIALSLNLCVDWWVKVRRVFRPWFDVLLCLFVFVSEYEAKCWWPPRRTCFNCDFMLEGGSKCSA